MSPNLSRESSVASRFTQTCKASDRPPVLSPQAAPGGLDHYYDSQSWSVGSDSSREDIDREVDFGGSLPPSENTTAATSMAHFSVEKQSSLSDHRRWPLSNTDIVGGNVESNGSQPQVIE